jgi:hypothetical protein
MSRKEFFDFVHRPMEHNVSEAGSVSVLRRKRERNLLN